MLLKISIIPIVLFALQINQSLASSRQCNTIASLEVCLGNKNLEVQVSPDDLTCEVGEVFKPAVRDDYTYIPGLGYYKFHNQAQNWNGARHTCIDEGAHLAVINSKEEEKAIIDLYNKGKQIVKGAKRPGEAWIGVHDFFAIKDWVTVLGDGLSSSGYVNWSKGCNDGAPEPNGGIKERCVSLYADKCQGWNDYPCEFLLPFVCEISDTCA